MTLEIRHELVQVNIECMAELQKAGKKAFDNEDYSLYKKYMDMVSELFLINTSLIYGDKEV